MYSIIQRNDGDKLSRYRTESHSHLFPFYHRNLGKITAGILGRSLESRLCDGNSVWMPAAAIWRHSVGDVRWAVLKGYVDHDHLNSILRVSGP